MHLTLARSIAKRTMRVTQKKSTLAFMAFSFRKVSSLTTSIHLRDSNLLRAPVVSFHRESLEVFDPAASIEDHEDGSAVIGLVEVMNRNDAKKAIKKSHDALEHWKFHTTAAARSQMLLEWSRLLREHTDDLANIMTLESGKPLRESIGEISYGISFIDYFVAEAIRPSSAGDGYLCPSPFPHIDGSPK